MWMKQRFYLFSRDNIFYFFPPIINVFTDLNKTKKHHIEPFIWQTSIFDSTDLIQILKPNLLRQHKHIHTRAYAVTQKWSFSHKNLEVGEIGELKEMHYKTRETRYTAIFMCTLTKVSF